MKAFQSLHRTLVFWGFLTLTAAIAQAAGGDRIMGTWQTPNGESKIEIAKCGDAYCGKIAWMMNPKNDQRNEDKSKRGRPLVGAEIVSNFQFDGAASWTGGKLYGPERGKTVDAKLVMVNDDTLEVRVSAGVVKKTVTWTRAK